MAVPTAVAPAGNQQVKASRAPRWGDKGVSERFIVQDTAITASPNLQQVPLADAGILSELQHHLWGTVTIAGASKDVFGPYDLINTYNFFAGSNTPLFSLSGRMLSILNEIEYDDTSFEAQSNIAGVMNPLANTSDFFNFPSATGTFRIWLRVPIALRLAGVPGGHVGYVTLQNKRIQNIIKPTFNMTGASPFSVTQASGFGNAPYSGGTATMASTTFETWKVLNTVPKAKPLMPLFGFTRYWQEIQQGYSGSSFTYNYEPGGELLRAVFQVVDNSAAGGVATANVNQISFQYGTNKQVDVMSPQRNIHEQLLYYRRALPQGVYVLDYYTRTRTLVNTKSTENTSNVQTIIQFASGYTPPANSVVNVGLDKIYVVQNYLGK